MRSSGSAGETGVSPARLLLRVPEAEDQDEDDIASGVKEESMEDDDRDTDRLTSDPEEVPGPFPA